MNYWTSGFVSTAPSRGAGYTDGFGSVDATVEAEVLDAPGNGGAGTVPIERGAPPSTYAVAAVVEGEKGALTRLVGVTAIRAVFIVPGVWLAAKILPKDKQLGLWPSAAVAMGASASISTGLVLWYWVKKVARD